MPRGIPHSTFLSWDPDDQDKALAWVLFDAQTCSGCGTRPEEWDPKQGGSHHAYVADLRRCEGCEAIGQAQRALQAESPDELGIRVGLTRPDDEEGERG